MPLNDNRARTVRRYSVEDASGEVLADDVPERDLAVRLAREHAGRAFAHGRVDWCRVPVRWEVW